MTARLDSIQVLRGAAALLVVLWHLGLLRLAIPRANLASAPQFLQFGYAGVELFFVLSGYIIMHITAGRPFDARTFLLRRVARIYPAYILFTLLSFAALSLAGAGDRVALDLGSLLRSLAILPQYEAPLFGPGWTLEHEVLFYALAGLLLAANRRHWIAPALFAAGGIGALLHGVGPLLGYPDPWDLHLFSPFQLGFASGAAIHEGRERLRGLGVRLPLLAGCLLTSAVAVILGSERAGGPWKASGADLLIEVVGFTASFALITIALLNAETRSAPGLRSWAVRWLTRIGDASYLLYLINYALLGALLLILRRLDLPGSALLPGMIAAVLACVLLSLAAHAWIERPFLARVSALIGPPSRSPAPPAARSPAAEREQEPELRRTGRR